MKAKISKEKLKEIWASVPVDYYQKGVKNNLWQRFWHTNKFKAVAELVNFTPKKILDVGCASGWFLNKMTDKFPKAVGYGVDAYGKAIEYGKIIYPRLKLRIADAHKLPYAPNFFDLVMCNEVLEHVVDPVKVLKEICRVVKPDGLVVVEMDSGSWLFRTVWKIWTGLNGKVWHNAHIQIFDTKVLRNTIEKAGLKIEKEKSFNLGMAVAFGCRTHLNPTPMRA